MKTNNTGGPAFPTTQQEDCNGNVVVYAETGMTLRDYFAGQALVGILADPGVKLHDGRTQKVANIAYELADAMLIARAEGTL